MAGIAAWKVGKNDWPQWGGWLGRNNTPDVKKLPTEWDVEKGENVKWAVRLGSQTYGNPTVANGKELTSVLARMELAGVAPFGVVMVEPATAGV